ncbi:hypothetical protein A9Q81_15190 [Gammaproteobacteria bacterium 42_54_T18]|nr:hypothetical protein A9Q81_15190 [Gammaproteobacteria bacterium 42_54_T18]
MNTHPIQFNITRNHIPTALVTLLAIFLCIFLSATANAFNVEEQVQISGFLSFGGGISNAEAYPGGDDPSDPEDTPNPEKNTPKYTAGSGRFIFDDKLNFDQDTRAGLQFDFIIDEKTSATLQFVSKGSVDNFDPDLSWAYLSYNIMPDLTIRAGRFRLPIYLASDYLDIGIAYPWIRPPTEVYSTINMSNLTGIDVLYSKQVGNWIWSAQPFMGASEFERGDFTSNFRDLYGINSSITNGGLSVRIAIMEYEFSVKPWPLTDDHAQLIQALRAAGFSELEEYGNPNDRTTTFLTAGISWHNNVWGFQSEWARRDNAESGPDVDGYYLTTSYHWNAWQPHITFASRKATNSSSRFHHDRPNLAVASPALEAAVVGLTNELTGIEDNSSESITVGINYSFSDAMIGKLEFSEIRNKRSTGLFEFATKHDKNYIASFVVDVIF